MTSSDLDRLRAQAKTLSEADRAELAHDLLATLDGKPDSGTEAAWEQEILLRLDSVRQGVACTINRNELSDRLRTSLTSPCILAKKARFLTTNLRWRRKA